MTGQRDPIDLAYYINNALKESRFPTRHNGYFAPRNTLRAITNSSVTHAIWGSSKSFDALDVSDRKLVEFISGQAPEIFAIGIYMDIDLKKMMLLFMKHDKTDKNLPISKDKLEKMWSGHGYKSRRRSFQDSQRVFRAQEFPMRDRFSVIELKPNVVLPILKSKHTSQGQFGFIYKVTLHKGFLDRKDPIRKVRRIQHHLLHYIHSASVLSIHDRIFVFPPRWPVTYGCDKG